MVFFNSSLMSFWSTQSLMKRWSNRDAKTRKHVWNIKSEAFSCATLWSITPHVIPINAIPCIHHIFWWQYCCYMLYSFVARSPGGRFPLTRPVYVPVTLPHLLIWRSLIHRIPISRYNIEWIRSKFIEGERKLHLHAFTYLPLSQPTFASTCINVDSSSRLQSFSMQKTIILLAVRRVKLKYILNYSFYTAARLLLFCGLAWFDSTRLNYSTTIVFWWAIQFWLLIVYIRVCIWSSTRENSFKPQSH